MAESACSKSHTLKCEHNVSLKSYNSWRIGGQAERLVRPSSIKDLQAYLQSLDPAESITWLGLGSNVLVRESGLAGSVIITQGLNKLSVTADIIEVEAGVPCAKLARFAARHGFSGAEFLAGIPGTVGGALKMNAGAWGGTTWTHVHSVISLDRQGQLHLRLPAAYDIHYRQATGPPDEAFVSACFAFPRGDSQTGLARIKQYLKERSLSQPIGTFNCGSVFKNPIGHHAAKLIEDSNLKGMRIGRAEVSHKHANFIINLGGATSDDVEQLMAYIIERVWQRTQIRLQPEVQILGSRRAG